ncbi:L,D-transpeptidase [Canicola haemoglobinophilus]|uniref:Carboxypeptidase n=1 Tax=Canicola haemoglobinophilus TaxID=733 RepID=A0A1V4AZW8_9PAST|nr:L,D-transpeptidase family protein [Canicola haemoglobinophilus]OOR99082.1 L,D-transpeptidase [Canicola haemoglobinophilus]STO60249.1 carboxypeptidase [Canicola haemoglobinophilus]
MQKVKLIKFIQLIPFLLGFTANLYAQENVSSSGDMKNITLTKNQLIDELGKLELQLSDEYQFRLEEQLKSLLGDKNLQFKSHIARIYAENDYLLLWENKQAEKLFLREYAAMVASGVSKRAAESLDDIYKESQVGGLLYDMLLTDAFLDYVYYSKNAKEFAQRWFYSVNSYKAKAPAEQDIQNWLSSIKNNDTLNFIQELAQHNSLYEQILDYLARLSGNESKSSLYKLAINAQRLRAIPDFNNGIFVNIPSYQLHYYRDGQLVLTSKVIVGKQARKTPVMYSKLSNVVVNPPWTPTTLLINEDIVPKIKRDPDYVARNGYTISDSSGQVIDPHSIDWSSIGSRFPYRIRQAPGDSALGNYKFNMPSSDAIYLHDTPSRGLFAKKNRALSSGCVRVEKSDQLATILLQEAGWTEERKQKVLSSKKTTSANIRSDNPVYLYYVTAWVENGVVQTLPDIYGYDQTPNLTYINWNVIQQYLN